MAQPAKQPQLLGSYLTDGKSRLSSLCRHIDFLAGLEKKLLDRLPDALQSHCKIANYSHETLILHTDSAVWAARLRYCTPDILRFMQSDCGLTALKTVRVRVKPPEHRPSLPIRGRIKISASTSDFVRQVANSITDKDLRKSLHNIAKHYREV